jgi:NADH:ubiquinone oxidoreductase subunit 6 (subunit J)
MDNTFVFYHFALTIIFLFHLLFFCSPIHSLFVFLFLIVTVSAVMLSFGLNYLGFVLISVYGGAIIVLFLLVSMLFNKKQVFLR